MNGINRVSYLAKKLDVFSSLNWLTSNEMKFDKYLITLVLEPQWWFLLNSDLAVTGDFLKKAKSSSIFMMGQGTQRLLIAQEYQQRTRGT